MTGGSAWPAGGVPADVRLVCSPYFLPGVVRLASGEVVVIDGTLFAVPVEFELCVQYTVWDDPTPQGSWLKSWASGRNYARTPNVAAGSWLRRVFNRD